MHVQGMFAAELGSARAPSSEDYTVEENYNEIPSFVHP